jgi:hypothetical protein
LIPLRSHAQWIEEKEEKEKKKNQNNIKLNENGKKGDDSSQVIVGRATKFRFDFYYSSCCIFLEGYFVLFFPFMFLFRLGSKCVTANCQCVCCCVAWRLA